MNKDTENRLLELAEKSNERGIYTYGDFHGENTVDELSRMRLPAPMSAFGGAEFCERKLVRFGNEETLGYSEPFPISIIKVTVKGASYSRPLTHRDFLGSVLGLGVDRSKIGDIFTDGAVAYICVISQLVPFITQNLTKCGNLFVTCEETLDVPETFAPKAEERVVTVASARLDAIICRLYNLSREEGAQLFKDGRVFCRGKQVISPSFRFSDGDVVSVRGHGKFKLVGPGGTSSKGKLRYTVNVYQ